MKSFLKAGFTLLALQSLAFGAGGLLVNKAKTDWTPQDGGKVTMTKINGTMQAISFTTNGNKDGENYIMDVVSDGGLGHGGTRPAGQNNAQQYTFAFQNPKKVYDESKVGYLEVIVDLSSAKSIPASITKKDETIKNNINADKVTSPEVYGQYKDNGIGFYMYSKKHASNEYQDGTNFGKCKNEIKNGKLDSTAKQFKIVIPDNLCTKQGNKETCKDNNYATLIFATDTFYKDCKTKAENANDFEKSKSNFFGIRLSVKHSTEKYSGSSLVLNNMSYNSGLSSGAGTYNLPTLIIGREEELPELCTPGMKEANEKARKAGRSEPYECNFNSQCVKVSCPNLKDGDTCWNCTGGVKKKQLLWAACGESDIKDEMDCRKTAARCEGRIGRERSRNYDLNYRYIRVHGDDRYELQNFVSVYDDKSGFWGEKFWIEFARCYSNEWGPSWGQGPKPEQYERKDSIYSSGYRWTYGNWRHKGSVYNADSSWTGIPCLWPTTLNSWVRGWFEYEVKTPKLFTISLREYANKDKDDMDHDKIPAFVAKFKIVNASTEVGTKVDDGLPYHEYTIKKVQKKFFKDKQIICYFLKTDGSKIGNVKVKLDGTEDEPTFTINTRDRFSPSDSVKGARIQCRFDLSDIGHTGYSKNDYDNKGLYNEFAYNIQLVSLKILNTAGANYKDLSLNTKCSFATNWKSRPARMGGEDDLESSPWRYIITDEYEYSYDSHQNADRAPKSKQRHFRFDARPLFYAANPVNDNDKLYAGYKYPEDKTKERALNPEEDLKYLSDKTANDKLIENRAIFFPQNYSGNVAALDIDAKDAEGKAIKGFTSSLTGVIASIYARDDELEFKQLPSIYSTNNKNSADTQKLYNQIENCFNDNICQAVWADLKPKQNNTLAFSANAFVYSDIVNGDKYLAYNNYGKTLLRLGDSEQTTFSQNNKTTHSDDPEPLCDVGEAKSTCDAGDPNCQKFRKDGGLYGCDTIVVNNSKAFNLQKMPADFERKGFKFYTFNPAMMKINTTLSNKSASNSPYNSEKFTYHRAPCSSYPDSTNCNDELENATFTIQVGAAGANKANILANNFLSRYDGQAKAPNDPAEDNIEFRSGLVTPVVVHPDNRNVNNPISTNEFRFKITSEQFKTMSLLLAPRCDTMKLGYSGLKEICRNGNTIDENNYIAKAEGAQLVTATKKMHNQQNTQGTQYLEQTHYQNLLAGASQNGVLDVTIFKTGFTKGVADLKNIDRTTNPKKDLGLLFGQKASEYSLKEKEPVVIKTEAKKVEVPDRTQEPKNQWLEDNKISAMVDATGGAAMLDVILVAPNKQVGGKTGDLKDNAVFLAAYTSNPLVAKELQDAKIIGDIIPGYANYYRIRRDAFPALNAKLFDYSVEGGGNIDITAIGQNEQSQKQSGDFLRVPAGKNINVKLMDPDAQMYCNFIRNCYPLPNGAGYGAIFTSFESKNTDWKGGSTIIDEAVNKAKTRPTQRRIAW